MPFHASTPKASMLCAQAVDKSDSLAAQPVLCLEGLLNLPAPYNSFWAILATHGANRALCRRAWRTLMPNGVCSVPHCMWLQAMRQPCSCTSSLALWSKLSCCSTTAVEKQP